MHKYAFLAWLTVLCLLFAPLALADETRRVYRAGEKEPFAQGEETLDLYVCPLLGADCMILMTQGQTMLVDMGKAGDYETIKGVMDTLSIERVDIAFNSHPHDDHLGSMKKMLNDYEIGLFMTAFPDSYSGENVIQSSTLKAVRAAGVSVQRVEDGDTFSLGNAQMTVIRQTKYKNPNPLSAMLKIEFGDCSLLLTADVIGSAQQYLAETHDLKADIFKFPHHGLNKVMLEFLQDIDAEYAFFTHGYSNTKDAQKELTKYGIPYDFATWGVIHLSTNGEYWLVEQELTEEGMRYTEKYR